jgi:hypothetical protein
VTLKRRLVASFLGLFAVLAAVLTYLVMTGKRGLFFTRTARPNP